MLTSGRYLRESEKPQSPEVKRRPREPLSKPVRAQPAIQTQTKISHFPNERRGVHADPRPQRLPPSHNPATQKTETFLRR